MSILTPDQSTPTTPALPASADAPTCCDPTLTRRRLMEATALAAAVGGTTTVFGDAVMQTAYGAPRAGRPVLVVLSLRGAADGLSIVAPYGDPTYLACRGWQAIGSDRVWGGDGFFGWNDDLKALQPLWNQRKLAAVHAVGLPIPNRSHFSAMEQIEDADPTSSVRTGWLNRLIGLRDGGPLAGFNVDEGVTPTSLSGPAPSMGAAQVDRVSIAGSTSPTDRRMRSLHALWDGEGGALGLAARRSFTVVKDFKPVLKASAKPRNGAKYPNGDLGTALATAARVIRGDVGVQVLTVDYGAWDMHANLGVNGGDMSKHCQTLAQSIAAFFTDLGKDGDRVTLITVTEFGRRMQLNSQQGLDHGWGSVMLLAGAGVNGGRFYSRFPDLDDTLEADLTVTTDYRTILSEIVEARFGVARNKVFPGFAERAQTGLMRPA